ncbi:DUF4174 domain-containing protein [Croceitalea rosinachiae]|uniref:DUF4174 domain-containing protein n=1 Tax=Croceitalea rosinachiae TaxID=3075596 RepID=A0ABU3AE06_9FLAO|nr:DUF4174 domain-containing protein [Croceitalea sp. F388]MDT0608427.1 DUF4174 domain-containing protein [Croceitalea sp. F388]
MKILVLICCILICQNSPAQELKKYQWKNRLIVLIGNQNHPKLKNQEALLNKNEEGLKERDILIIRTNDRLLEPFKLKKNFTGLLLIGKDGGIKLKQSFIVQPDELFALIDGMPMRRAEISRKKG